MIISDLVNLAKSYEAELPPMPVMPYIDDQPISNWIDHTLLKPDATPQQIENACLEGLQYQFASVCINPIYVPQTKMLLEGSRVKPCTVVGFPLGAVPRQIKRTEARTYIENGAAELDMVLGIGLLKGGQYEAVYEDVEGVVQIAHQNKVLVKVILETCLLTRTEKIMACLICQAAGADFVKTSTGLSTGGATVEDIELMRRVVGPVERMGVKASGGIRSLSDARTMLMAGANRLGTSGGVKITQEALQEKKSE